MNRLTKDFYEKEVLLQAIEAYKSLATISFSEDSNFYYYEIRESVYDAKLVESEFENYILGLMNT